MKSALSKTNKRVLLIAYYYYQKESPASKRTKGLCQYLSEYGWDVTLLTGQPSNVQLSSEDIVHVKERSNIIRTKALQLSKQHSLNVCHNNESNNSKKSIFVAKLCKLGIKILNIRIVGDLLYRILFHPYPYEGYGWFRPAVKAGKQVLSEKKYDAIISTQSPIAAHCIAHELKVEFDIPWIADYRDLWSQWDLSQRGCSVSRREKNYHFECELIEVADVLTVVSEPWASELEKQHKDKPVYVIPNGYDPRILNLGTKPKLDSKFSILHSGEIYGRKRSPEYLFRAVRELINEGVINIQDLSLDFYGPEERGFENDVKKYSLEGCVHLHGIASHQHILEYQRKAQVLLLLTSDNAIDVGCYPAKVFEYLAARRPILSYGYSKDCVISNLLQETSAGCHLLTYSAIKKQIAVWYDEWRETGVVGYDGDMMVIEQYSHRGMAQKFANILSEVVQNN